MAHTTALLIVLTLAGEPAANALCINWCNSPSAMQGCGEAIATSTTPQLLNATTTCVALLGVTPFLREEARSSQGLVAAADLPPAVAETPDRGRRPLGVCRHRDATAGHPLPTLVLRV
jgi:hypothetical protein